MNFLNRALPHFHFDENAAGAGGAGAGAGGAGTGAGAGADKGTGAGGAGAGADKGAGAGGAGEGGAAKPFYSDYNLDQDSVAWIEERKFGNVADVIKAGREGSKLARDRNVIPKPDPKNPQGWDGFTEIGWTPDRTKYVIEPPTRVDGDIHDETAFTKFQGVAHEARLAPWQAKAVYDAMHKQSNDTINGFKAAGADANKQLDTKLRGEWGKDYDTKVELGKRAFSFFKPDTVTSAQMDAAMGSAAMVQMFTKIGEAMGEDKLVTAHGDGISGMSVAGAKAERMRLEANADWMKIFNDPRHPQQKDYVAQRQRLLDREAGQR